MSMMKYTHLHFRNWEFIARESRFFRFAKAKTASSVYVASRKTGKFQFFDWEESKPSDDQALLKIASRYAVVKKKGRIRKVNQIRKSVAIPVAEKLTLQFRRSLADSGTRRRATFVRVLGARWWKVVDKTKAYYNSDYEVNGLFKTKSLESVSLKERQIIGVALEDRIVSHC